MLKCFLSHSSQNKAYVRDVVSRLRKEITIFDELTFEEGMSPIEEIVNGLDTSSLFVLFISSNALMSDWVKRELEIAKNLADAKAIERIYPIIIESGITYTNAQIPEWLRDNFNIQPIFKPSIAARKINARLMELTWKYHPRIKERHEIFVGRNLFINQIEERLNDYSKPCPVALIASGLNSIGRRSLLKYAAKKSNLVRESYDFPPITLSQFDSIEDFVLKIYDHGFITSDITEIHGNIPFDKKIDIAKNVCLQIAQENERIFIEDKGCLIQHSGEIVDWFQSIVNNLVQAQQVIFIIASRFKPIASTNRTIPTVFSVAVPELDKSERNGLMSRYAKFHEMRMNPDEMAFFSDLLTGYPEQVLYAVDLIRENGVFNARKQSHLIQQYASDKARIVLSNYTEKPIYLDFIYFLSKFEFISYEVVFDIVDYSIYNEILDELIATSICERIGNSSDYIRVNDIIRDYISRSRFGTTVSFQDAINSHIRKYLISYNGEKSDISDYLFSAQEALKQGSKIPDNLLIPSVLIKTIKKLYDEDRNYQEAITLADRVLGHKNNFHVNSINHIRYIKCQCLARLRNSSFFAEVQQVNEPDKSFLHGFYYRLSGDYEKAESSFMRVLRHGRRDSGVLGELVLVYMQSDEHGRAYDLAKENYIAKPSNPINVNNYIACLITKDKTPEIRRELESAIETLSKNPSDRAQEMYLSAKARFIAYYDNDMLKSKKIIDEAIAKFPRINYPLLTKSDLAIFFEDKSWLSEAVSALETTTGKNAQTYRSFIKYKAMLLAMNGNLHQAQELVRRELSGLISSAFQRLNEKLVYLASK